MGLVFKWIKRNGGVEGMQKMATEKSNIIYDIISSSNNFYYCPVKNSVRSRMNVPFRIGGPNGNDDLEKEFLSGAQKLGMLQLKGHRYVEKEDFVYCKYLFLVFGVVFYDTEKYILNFLFRNQEIVICFRLFDLS